jgi:hypothetical protein
MPGELIQMLAVEGRSGVAATSIGQRFPARRIEGDQLVSGCKPDELTVVGDSVASAPVNGPRS